jgi:small-conductance mechanosensitive channel
MSVPLQVVTDTAEEFSDGVVSFLPDLLAGLVLVALAYPIIKLVLWVVGSSLSRVYGGEQKLIADLLTTVVSILLWFGVGLAFLNTVGMGEIAASLGTATGFIALGVSYALSEMIEDTVAGVYLLRDPNFNVGDRVETDDATGTVAAIELRKSRIETDSGDMEVVANRMIESHWTHDLPDEGE